MNDSVFIRPQVVDDALVSYQWRNNPLIWKFTGSRPDKYITPEMEKEWLEDILQREDQARFAICAEPEGKYIGNIFLTDIKDRQAFIHIFIGDMQYWGKRRAIDAMVQMVNYAFDVLMLDAIYGEIKPQNSASLALAKASGFKEVDGQPANGDHIQFVKMVYTRAMYKQIV